MTGTRRTAAPRPAAARAPGSLIELLIHRAALHPGHVALRNGAHSLDLGTWLRRSAALAAGLLGRGLRPGDPVALRYGSAEWTEYAVAFCGVQWAGGIAVPLSDRSAPAAAAHVLADCGAVGVLHSPDGTPPPLPDGVWAEAGDRIEAQAPAGPPPAPPAPSAPAQYLYTSGTTGLPKGVGATHANLAHGCTLDERRRPLRHSRTFLHSFPIGTNAGQTMLVNCLNAAATGVAAPQFTPLRFLRLVEEHRAGSVFLVPATAVELLSSPALARCDLSSVRLVGSTAAALPNPVALRLSQVFTGAQIVNYYTSTEAAPAQVTLLYDPGHPDSPGLPASLDQLRITGPDGGPLPAGESGEIWLRSPTDPRTYLGATGADLEVFRGPWVRMGDLGMLDGDGYLHLLDRERDVVKSGAYKVSTLQVENALHAHPDVVDAAAFGIPHPVLGSVVAAVVVPRRGEPDAARLRAFLLDRLAVHELPARLLFRDTLPRNEGGKVLKRELHRLLDDEATTP
ncbi:class I adenylate-forming enzyme family protein [Streptomyces nitrosporeus]|uniref:class I adenylate-forming enzyme family protein n=1 Tax=Streptomyces nitrosporeus TaxID=28894 RepID=UPI003D9DBE1D